MEASRTDHGGGGGGRRWSQSSHGNRRNKTKKQTYTNQLTKQDKVNLLYDEVRKLNKAHLMMVTKDELYDNWSNLSSELNRIWADLSHRLNNENRVADGKALGCQDSGGSLQGLRGDEQAGWTVFDQSVAHLLDRGSQFSPTPQSKSPPMEFLAQPDPIRELLPPAPNTVPMGVPVHGLNIPSVQTVLPPTIVPKKLAPQSASIKWISPADEYLGQFFINKVYLDKDKSQSWQPSHFVDCTTKIVSFEELIPVAGLEKVLLSEDRELHSVTNDNCLHHFPSAVDMTLLCGKNLSSHDMDSGPFIHHIACQACTDNPERPEFETCSECRKLQIWPVNGVARDHKSKFILLRYADHVRFIIAPACLSRLQWERFGLFGWYCDLPVRKSWINQSEDIASSPFGIELELFIAMQGIAPTDYLNNVDYSVLSPAIQLVFALKGKGLFKDQLICLSLLSEIPETDLLCGFKKTDKFLKELYWPEVSERKSVCVTYGLGSSDGVLPTLSKLFNLRGDFKNVKIIYPSMKVVSSWARKLDLQLSTEQWMELYRNRDQTFQSYPYLHDLECTEGVPPKANVFMQYEEIQDEFNPDYIRHYGWLLVGSQSVGEGSWGSQLRQTIRYYRNELAVGIFPYVQEMDKGSVIHSADLAVIGQLFHSPLPYKDMPAAFTNKNNDRLYHMIGIVKQKPRGATIVKGFQQGHSLHSVLGDFDLNQQQSNSGQPLHATLRDPVIHTSGYNIHQGNVIEFFAAMDTRPRELAVQQIVRFFNTLEEACENYGVKYDPDLQQSQSEPDTGTINYVGKLARICASKAFGFIDELRTTSQLRKLAPEYLISTFPPPAVSFFLHSDLCPGRQLPFLNSIVIFTGMVINAGNAREKPKLRVSQLFEAFKSEDEAKKQLGITQEPVELLKSKKSDLDIKRATMSLESDEDFYRYFQKQFEGVNIEINKTVIPTQSDLEIKYAMRTTKMSSDIDWLNRHFKWVCNGEFPKRLEGAHSEFVQSRLITVMKEKHMPV